MEMLLDSNTQNILYNLKAKKKMKKLQNNIAQFDDEIRESLAKCEVIFDNNNARENYIKKLDELQLQMDNNSNKRVTIESLEAEKESIIHDFKEFQNSLPLTVKEDLLFYIKKIEDRQRREEEDSRLLNEIEMNYPDAKDFDVNAAYNVFPFSAIRDYYNETESVSENVESTVFTSDHHSLPYVISIRQYSKEKEAEEEYFYEEETTETVSDNSFYGVDDKITEALNNEEPSYTDTYNELVESSDEDIIEATEEVQIEEPSIDTQTVNNDDDIENTESEPEELEYPLDEGISLADLALALCDDEKGWTDIYKANKSVLDPIINENSLNINQAKKETTLFAGITLKIPNEFKKEEL